MEYDSLKWRQKSMERSLFQRTVVMLDWIKVMCGRVGNRPWLYYEGLSLRGRNASIKCSRTEKAPNT